MKPRILVRKRYIVFGDLFLIGAAALGSFAMRTDLGPLFVYYLPQALWLVGIALIVKPIVFYLFGLYSRLWVYASIQELKLIIVAVSTSSFLVSLIFVLLRVLEVLPNYPRSTLLNRLVNLLGLDWGSKAILTYFFRESFGDE